MKITSKFLFSSLVFASSLCGALRITTKAIDFTNVKIGQPLNLEWTDAGGPVKIVLLYSGLEIPLAGV